MSGSFINLMRGKRPQLIRTFDASALLKLDDAELVDEPGESAYRRGYTQGYSQAMDDFVRLHRLQYSRVRECFNWLAKFFDDELMAWRMRYHCGNSDDASSCPPRFKPPWTWSEARAFVLDRDKECTQCGATERLEVDHILPVSEGGRAEPKNLRVLCWSCHRINRR